MGKAIEKKSIVILGASYAGITTTHHVLKHLIMGAQKADHFEAVLVSPSRVVVPRPVMPRALLSEDMFPQDKVFTKIEPLFQYAPQDTFRFVHGTATGLDTAARVVSVQPKDGGPVQELPYYALVVATGANPSSPLFGLTEDDVLLKEQLKLFREAMPKAKSIVISGGGPTGVETAGELGEYLNGKPGWFSSKLSNPKVPITLLTTDSQILPRIRSSLAEKAEAHLSRVGVTVIKNVRPEVSPADAGTVANVAGSATVTLPDGKTLAADLYVKAWGYTPNTKFVPAELLDGNNKIKTNPTTLRVDDAGALVYAVGDCSNYSRGGISNLIPGLPLLGSQIKRDILLDLGETQAAGAKELQFKEDTRTMQFVPVGHSLGVGEAMGWAVPTFVVALAKGRDYMLGFIPGWWNGSFAKEK